MTGPAEKLSRREQHRAAIRAGLHPLSLVGPQLALHAGAPVDSLDEQAAGNRCGGCLHRVRLRYNGPQSYPKCVFPGREGTREDPGGDVRAWWPACVDYQPRPDHGTSGDGRG